jgi:hypothetical protein
MLENVITTLQHLYPDILDYEVESEEQILADYTYRPAGLDEELMEIWLHLLPDAVDCLGLLKGFLEFIKVEDALAEKYESAKDFCVELLKSAQQSMKLRSEMAANRRKALRAESNTLGQVFLYKIQDISEPWIITPTELAVIIDAVYQAEEQNEQILALMKFFNTAADSDGCTLLYSQNN